MRLREYFAGRAVSLVSRLEPREVERRINDSACSPVNPFASGVVGWARFGLVHLQLRSEISSTGQPVLAGRIRREDGGSRLDLAYRAPLLHYAFFLLWYVLVAGLLIQLWTDAAPAGRLVGTLMLSFFLAFPIAVHRFSSVGAEADLDDLVDFLERVADARRLQ